MPPRPPRPGYLAAKYSVEGRAPRFKSDCVQRNPLWAKPLEAVRRLHAGSKTQTRNSKALTRQSVPPVAVDSIAPRFVSLRLSAASRRRRRRSLSLQLSLEASPPPPPAIACVFPSCSREPEPLEPVCTRDDAALGRHASTSAVTRQSRGFPLPRESPDDPPASSRASTHLASQHGQPTAAAAAEAGASHAAVSIVVASLAVRQQHSHDLSWPLQPRRQTRPSPPDVTHRVRETHKALIDSDVITGRKSINQYEVIEEIGRGMHGKVKLARNTESSENVAIKIIPRFSKKRRLGKVTAMSPQDKTKKEIAILKKIRHPNVVALLEVIDDPELKKIYMVLEHVELGEIVWRKKGLPHVCLYERRRAEREMRGEAPTMEEQLYDQMLERRQAIKELKRAKMAQNFSGPTDYWSVEYGAADDMSVVSPWSRISSREDFAATEGSMSQPMSRRSSLAPSRSYSTSSSPGTSGFHPREEDEWQEDDHITPGPSQPALSTAALDGSVFGHYRNNDDTMSFRERSPSMADSIISHMSSIDYNPRAHDPFADDFSYVPCFTFDQARSAFRDTVLGLEYLHYQGVVHRDIKPANLLWSKDHRVKISDFGVSYFGRPIRDGEPDDLVSESEAKDFDDDLELSKTVGTPAFFAPELCYTDPDKAQPKVSEQIDVWSLGVTLYCLIYARIPFLAEDEFQMFRKIATEDVYIPRKRLKPVDPSTSPAVTSLYKRQNTHPYRDDNDLEYEDVDNLLYDLLRQMLTKNPEKRIRLKDIKRHPWVLQGLPNPRSWLEETDPAKPSSGRKIQVDERDLSSAVVPLTFLERARSVVKKTIGRVMHPLVDRSESRSRRRATSSVASSGGDSMPKPVPVAAPATNPPTPHIDRRRSLHPDDYIPRMPDRDVLSNLDPRSSDSVAAKAPVEAVAYDPMATVLPPLPTPTTITRGRSHSELDEAATSDFRQVTNRGLGRSGGTLRARNVPQFLPLTPHLGGPHTVPASPSYDRTTTFQTELPSARSELNAMRGDTSRSPSADRSLFVSHDKRGTPQVALNTAVAPGNIPGLRSTRSMRSVDLGKNRYSYGLSSSPLSSSPQSIPSSYHQHRHLQSDPNFHHSRYQDRPTTAHRVDTGADIRSPLTRTPVTMSPEPVYSASYVSEDGSADMDSQWPSRLVHQEWQSDAPSRRGTIEIAKTASTDSMDHLGTPLTSPSETASPVAACPSTSSASQRMLVFQSDPSLPALLSGASSVSADLEGELLLRPGTVGPQGSFLESKDSLTPPALAKEPIGGFPIDQVFGNHPSMEGVPLRVKIDGPRPPTLNEPPASHHHRKEDEEDNDDDSDEGLLMAKSKKRPPVTTRHRPFEARRRDTNMSTASDETARRVNIA
ncbi:serine threonine kinase [Trichoderma arundinaceum]|uniref:non-specific serine/threonine protein kinase n=1 Tax=Trichoderma arundinaceum TaxID=490622 RepID=A0A395NWI0_TRIAR|nr:serine threonine kinase [Trichoderma arundinaceum]